MQRLEGKTVAILVANEFEDIELFYPLIRLSEEGAKIVVGTVPLGFHPRPFVADKPITGRFGLTIPAPWLREGNRYTMRPVSKLQMAEIDAVVIPGGFCPDNLRRDPAAVALVREAAAAGKVVAAICHGPWLLCSAEVIHGRKVTGFLSIRDDVVHAGGEWVDAPVVQDGPIITSRTPDDLPEFCQAIIAALQG
ncbi:MAG: type 1 glutamine amidotransferase domain-containing protein [Chloroflexota bacterium]